MLALLLVACPTTVPPVPPIDANRMDTGVGDAGRDAARSMDANVDADAGPPDDTGIDSPTGIDANVDAGNDAGSDANFDAGNDAGSDANVDGGHDAGNDANIDAFRPDAGPCDPAHFNVCACRTFGADCSATACGTGEACLVDECGMHCAKAGHPCADGTDCATTSSCVGAICVHAGGGCSDSRDCPRGFACEAGACHDRRIGCRDISGLDCPYGFQCDEVGTSFCARLLHHCGTMTSCLGNTCTDIDGDGTTECTFHMTPTPGGCHRNAECAPRLVCSAHPDLRIDDCGRYGACRTATDCPTGMLCQDLWGDGISECVETGGTCAHQTDCTGRAVCATPADGGPPTCIAVPFGA